MVFPAMHLWLILLAIIGYYQTNTVWKLGENWICIDVARYKFFYHIQSVAKLNVAGTVNYSVIEQVTYGTGQLRYNFVVCVGYSNLQVCSTMLYSITILNMSKILT